jgi:hypothetical protein
MIEINKEKNIELIKFLNQEKLNKKINNKKIYTFYNKCLIKSIIELKKKFNNIDNKNICIENGINMIYYIFFILIFYTNNIKLTIFLLERSILFYTEFIIMSQDKKLIDQICFIPNINDALFFTYKKTLGPLKICNMKVKNDQLIIRDICRFINLFFKDCILNNGCNFDNLNYIQNELCREFILLINQNNKEKMSQINNFIIEIVSKKIDIKKKILIINLFLNLLNSYEKLNKKINYDFIIKNLINELETIKFLKNQNIKEYKIYKILINNNEL